MGKKITCILCPRGCSIEKVEDKNEIKYIGYGCQRGYSYAIDEFTNPKRILTTTIYVENGNINFLPVKTDKPIPRNMLFDAMSLLRKVKVKAPVHIGEVIIQNILNTGADVVATRSVETRDTKENLTKD